MLLLGDFSLVLLTMPQLYSVSLADVFLFLFILPLGILLPFPVGINALFSHGPRRSAGLARVYALWNVTSLINVVVAFICGYIHYSSQPSRRLPYFQPWNILKRSRKFQPEDRLFSLSSITSPAAEEHAAGRDVGGISANGQGKPKKGRGGPRDAKRLRQSSEPDFDYDDDADLM